MRRRELILIPLLIGAPLLGSPSAYPDGTAADTAARQRAGAAVTTLLETVRRKHGVPALGGAVVARRATDIGAAGLRVIDGDKKVTPADRWHIGSCTKSMTATLIGALVEQGKLGWDMTLAEAFPDLVQSMHPAWKSVTLELLLGNRGGAPEDLDADGLWRRLRLHKGTPTEARRLLTRSVLAKPPETAPGTRYAYSNAGFAIAGHAAESVMKEPWEALMRRVVFAPLGMDGAGFGAPGDALLFDQPFGHAVIGGRLRPILPGPGADNPVAIGPAGTVHLPLQDWGRYVAHHLGIKSSDSKGPAAPSTRRKLHAPLEGQEYALGWIVTQRAWGGGTVLTHAGSNTMWYAVAWLAPRRSFAVLVTCNQGGVKAANACDEAASGLIRWHLGRAQRRAGK